jgi:O-antigen/teichoic acid export membrane protein
MTSSDNRDPPPSPRRTSLLHRHLRGSLLLLVGRVLPMGMTFAGQILTVRYLTKLDYGGFAFALFCVEFASLVAALGMDKAISRWVPMYQEQDRDDHVLGALALAVTTVLAAGMLLTGSVFVAREYLRGLLGMSAHEVQLLLILSLIVPLAALDAVMLAAFTIFAGVRVVFLRRHLLGPGLRLAAVVTVVCLGGNVVALAWSHFGAAMVLLAANISLLCVILKRRGLLQWRKFRQLRIPLQEVTSLSFPLIVGLMLVVLLWLLVLWISRRQLAVASLFPELHRFSPSRASTQSNGGVKADLN